MDIYLGFIYWNTIAFDILFGIFLVYTIQKLTCCFVYTCWINKHRLGSSCYMYITTSAQKGNQPVTLFLFLLKIYI